MPLRLFVAPHQWTMCGGQTSEYRKSSFQGGGRDPPELTLELAPSIPSALGRSWMQACTRVVSPNHTPGAAAPTLRDQSHYARHPEVNWSPQSSVSGRPYTDTEYRTEERFRLGACFPPLRTCSSLFLVAFIVRLVGLLAHADCYPRAHNSVPRESG